MSSFGPELVEPARQQVVLPCWKPTKPLFEADRLLSPVRTERKKMAILEVQLHSLATALLPVCLPAREFV